MKCILEPIIDETNSQKHVKGSLYFSDDYKLYWIPSTTVQYFDIYNKSLSLNGLDVFYISPKETEEIKFFCENEGDVHISINCGKKAFRQLKIFKNKMVSLFILLQKLVCVGLAFPVYKNNQFSLELNRKFQNIPIFEQQNKQMIFPSDISFKELFISLVNYSKDLICGFPIETGRKVRLNELMEWADKPFKAASQILVNKILDEADNFFIGLKKITKNELDDLFDQHGIIKNPIMLKHRLFLAGCEKETLPELLPFILGAFDWNSSNEERKQLELKWKRDCDILFEQLEVVSKTKDNKQLRGFFNVIENDIERTDRKSNTFLISGGAGMNLAITVLNLYVVFNTSYGYIQGLNDHIAELIYIYFPHWNEDSNPIDNDGNIIDYKPFIPKLFELFKAEIHKLRFDKNIEIEQVSERTLEIEGMVFEYLDEFAPFISYWIKALGLKNLLFLYSDIHLIFRRKITDIWSIWVQMFSSPEPENWIVILFTSFIICTFHKWENDQSFIANIDLVSMEPDIEKVKKVAVWIYNKKRLPLDKFEEEKNLEFKFFNV